MEAGRRRARRRPSEATVVQMRGTDQGQHDESSPGGVCVTASRVWLLPFQKPIQRPGWWKGKFASFWMPAITGEGGCSPHPTPTDNQGARAFIDGGRELHAPLTGHDVVNFFHLVGVSVSTRQLTGYVSGYYL